MARIKRGILGGFSKKIGNIVGTSWKGIAVMKSLPLSVANPRTTGQVNQRIKFSACVAIASQLLGAILKPAWDSFASQMSGFNMFVQTNTIQAFDNAGNLIAGNLKMSPGTLMTVESSFATPGPGAGALIVSWDSGASIPQALTTDKMYLAVIDTDGKVVATSSGTVERSTGTAVVTTNRPLVSGEDLETYLFFVSADKKKSFASYWLEVTVS